MRRSLFAVLTVGVLMAAPSEAAAVDGGGAAGEESPPPAEAADPRESWALDGPVVVWGADGVVLEVDGRGRYLDTLELRATGGDVALLVNELSMDDYITGIAEMPTRWPLEALKAQAVAARTYAWRAIERGTWANYDICATVACQVFRGADVVLDAPTGHRWQQAVAETSGEVLVDADGRPILARYFSTSGGRTYANEDVFPSDGAHDYLVGIDDPYDELSPLHRWNVTFTREEFEDILSRGTRLSAVVPVAAVERIGDVDDSRATVRVTGRNGRVADVAAVEFRRFVSDVAARHFPDRFPGLRDDGEAPLPATMPSSRFEIEIVDDEVIIQGQGWGHGVGMGQYGAFGRAEAGAAYREILAAYYGGLEPTRPEDLPERVRVGMTTSVPAFLRADGPFTIADGERTVVADVLGTWTLERADSSWRLGAPAGHGESLRASVTGLAGDVPEMDDAVTLEIEVNKPVRLSLVVRDTAGVRVLERPVGVVDAGLHAATWRFDDDDGRTVDPGAYHVVLRAEDADGAVADDPVAVEVPEPPPPPTAAPRGDEPTRAPSLTVPVAVGVLGVLLIAGAVLVRRRN